VNIIASLQTLLIFCPRTVDFNSTNVLGSPPTWFIKKIIDSLVETPDLEGEFYVYPQSESIQCTPVQLVKQTHDNVIDDLCSGQVAYLDLNSFQRNHQAIHRSVEEAQTHLKSTQGVDILGTFAISEAWISKFSKECLKALGRDEGVDIGVGT
jgi:hypothetical protein